MMRPKRNNTQAKLAYCEKCGKLYSSMHGEKLCPTCNAEEQAAMDKIKDYMRDNPKATIKEAAEATGANADSVKRLTMEVISAKLSSNKKIVESAHPCAHCGTMIKSGTYCPACASELQKKAQQNAATVSVISSTNAEPAPKVVKGLDDDFNKALKEKPARRRMYQSVIDGRRSK